MKKLLFFTLSVILFTSCEKEKKTFQAPKTSIDYMNEKEEQEREKLRPKGKLTEITFNKMEHDFGQVKKDALLTYTFKFENTGENELVIMKAFGSCGCTVPEYSKEPIKPGEEGKIKVSFDTKGKHGEQSKTITVYANTRKNMETLKIKASLPGGKPQKDAPKPITSK